MEATPVYWKPVYYLLEDDFELLLVNAQQVKKRARPQDRRPGCPGLRRLLESSGLPTA